MEAITCLLHGARWFDCRKHKSINAILKEFAVDCVQLLSIGLYRGTFRWRSLRISEEEAIIGSDTFRRQLFCYLRGIFCQIKWNMFDIVSDLVCAFLWPPWYGIDR